MNAMTTIKGWARELIDLSLLFIAVGVIVQIIFGKEDTWYFGTVTDRLIEFVQQLGNAGFVGLIAPHLVRARVGFKPGATLIPAMLMGAVLVLAADILVRLMPTAYELQLGVFTSLVGAPFLVQVVRRARAAWLAT